MPFKRVGRGIAQRNPEPVGAAFSSGSGCRYAGASRRWNMACATSSSRRASAAEQPVHAHGQLLVVSLNPICGVQRAQRPLPATAKASESQRRANSGRRIHCRSIACQPAPNGHSGLAVLWRAKRRGCGQNSIRPACRGGAATSALAGMVRIGPRRCPGHSPAYRREAPRGSDADDGASDGVGGGYRDAER